MSGTKTGRDLHDELSKALKREYERGRADGLAQAERAIQALMPGKGKAERLAPESSRRSREANKPSTVGTIPRGQTEQAVEAAFRNAAPRPLSPIQVVRKAREHDGTVLAETSARRAIDRLEYKGVIERIDGTVTWRIAPKLRSVS